MAKDETIKIELAKKDCDRFLMLLKIGLEVSVKQNWNKQKVPRRVSEEIFQQLVKFTRSLEVKKKELVFSEEFQKEVEKVLDHFEEESLIERATQQFSKREALIENWDSNLKEKELEKRSHEFAEKFYLQLSEHGLLNFHLIESEADARKALKWLRIFEEIKP